MPYTAPIDDIRLALEGCADFWSLRQRFPELDEDTLAAILEGAGALASTPRIRRGDDWIDGHTTWVNIECSNRLADNARDSLAKGDPVVVFGRLRTKVWESEGTKHERMVIVASSIGHDLSRGSTAFPRFAWPRQREEADPERDDGDVEPGTELAG